MSLLAGQSPRDLAEFLKAIKYPLQRQIVDSRSQVLKEACLLVTQIARSLAAARHNALELERFLECFVSKGCLCKVLHSANSVIHDMANATIKSIFSIFTPHLGSPALMARVLSVITELVESKSTVVRVCGSEYLVSLSISNL